MARAAYDEPMDVSTVEGEIVLTAPGGAASVALTPRAAMQTAERLQAAAATARDGGQERAPGGEAG